MINKTNEETISELKTELNKNKQLNEKSYNSLVDKFKEIQEINSKYNEEISLIKKENNMLKEEIQENNNTLISNNNNIEKTIIQQKQELTIKYDNRINKLREDIIHLVMNPKDEINKVIKPEELEKNFLIKTGQEWSPIKDFTEYQMQYDGQTIKVTGSPPYENLPNHYLPPFLFNGIKDNLGGKNWVTKSLKNEFIKINFSSPVIANFLYTGLDMQNGKASQSSQSTF